MRLRHFAILCGFSLLPLVGKTFAQDESPRQPNDAAKVCIATVANASTTSAFVERLTDRLMTNLKQNKINAITMKSRTTNKYPLQMNSQIGEEAKKKECDYVVLSQIRDPRQQPLVPQLPQIAIGGRVPSTDASDSRPVYRHNLELAFALFRIGRLEPILDTTLADKPSASVSDMLLPAMDREADRVANELNKR